MATTRVTQSLLTMQAQASINSNGAKLATLQSQMSTGKQLQRPSDSPADAAASMSMRAQRGQVEQQVRAAQDGLGWLDQADTALQSMGNALRRVREISVTANNSAINQAGRDGMAAEVEQIRQGLIANANTTYLDRPIFGGTTASSVAVASDGTFTSAAGTAVYRRVGPNIDVPVSTDLASFAGPSGASMFDDLAALATALRTGDGAGIATGATAVSAAENRVTSALTDIGARRNRVDKALWSAQATSQTLSARISEVEDVDLAEVSIGLKMAEVTYQAALAATARAFQPTLQDFLR